MYGEAKRRSINAAEVTIDSEKEWQCKKEVMSEEESECRAKWNSHLSNRTGHLSRRDLKQEQKRKKPSKKLKYCCKRMSVAKHSHGLYYKDMQSFSCPAMGFVTAFILMMILAYAAVTLTGVL